MAMEDFAVLKSELVEYIKSKGSVSAREALEWAKGRGVSELILFVLVQELLESEDFRGEGGFEVIEPVIHLEIPARIVYAKKPPQPAKPATSLPSKRPKETKSGRRTKPKPSQTLLKFLESGEEKERKSEGVQGESSEDERSEEPAEPTPQTPPGSEAKEEIGVPSEAEKLSQDPDFSKALRYLGRYWSVGRLRFLEDMVSEGVELSKAEKILIELRRLGLVELTENNVINAREELRRLYGKPQTSTSLYDVFKKK